MTRAPIFTIGHSDRTWEELVDHLKNCDVKFVVDVRTKPYSKRYAHFNLEVLREGLPHSGLKYVHLGAALGARFEDPELLDSEGRVSYRKVRQTGAFIQAIERLEKAADSGRRLVLFCTEAHPCKCHRFPMIAYQLAHDGFEVRHILRDGSVKTQAEVETELLDGFATKITQRELFQREEISATHRLEAAYEQLNRELAEHQLQKTRVKG
jgi:uncharacterized protein (DUF488 family)